MSKFKVGDRVKYKNHPASGKILEINNLGAIIECENPDYGTYIQRYPDKRVLWPSELQIEFATPDRYELHITCYDGKTTNAVYKVNGKVEKRSQALCAPSDTFDFETGLRTAIDRMFIKAAQPTQPEPQEDKPKYEVGDKVKVIKNTCYHRSRIGDVLTLKRRFPEYDNSNNFAWSVWENVSYKFIRESDLEPYTEPEQPKYYNGKVVCVDAGSLSNITVGKVYSVKDGKITHDDANVSPWFTSGYESVEDLNDKASRYSKAKFIEYKGEAQ